MRDWDDGDEVVVLLGFEACASGESASGGFWRGPRSTKGAEGGQKENYIPPRREAMYWNSLLVFLFRSFRQP